VRRSAKHNSKTLRPNSMPSTSAHGVRTIPPWPTWKDGTLSPRQIAFSGTTLGIDTLCPRAACGLTRQTITLLLPARQKCELL
jgi:hypothetical protein